MDIRFLLNSVERGEDGPAHPSFAQRVAAVGDSTIRRIDSNDDTDRGKRARATNHGYPVSAVGSIDRPVVIGDSAQDRQTSDDPSFEYATVT